MFLTGTLLNVVAVLIGTTIGLLFGAWVPRRMQESLTTGLGLFTLVIGLSMALQVFLREEVRPGDELAVLAGLLAGVVVGELLRLHEQLEALGAWFQRRLARGGEPSRIAEAFVTASLVFCVGPLAILGSIENGLSGDITLLATKSLLDGVASIAFAAALGAGVYLSAIAVFVVQGSIAAGAFLLRDVIESVRPCWRSPPSAASSCWASRCGSSTSRRCASRTSCQHSSWRRSSCASRT